MITIYLIGCLLSFIFLLVTGAFERNKITAQDLIVLPLYILSSWVFVLSMVFCQLFLWIDSITEDLDDIVIWKKKK